MTQKYNNMDLVFGCTAYCHALRVTAWENDPELCVTVLSNYLQPWYKRVWEAFTRKTAVEIVLKADDVRKLASDVIEYFHIEDLKNRKLDMKDELWYLEEEEEETEE